MNNFVCKKCGSVIVHVKENGTQIGLYCSECGAWIKWLGKDDKRLAELQIQDNKELDKVSESNEVSNDMVNKILDYVTKSENYFYDLAFKEMDKNNLQGNLAMTCQASSFQKVRYFIECLLEKNK